MVREKVRGGCFLSSPNGHAWLSHIMRAQQYKSAKGLHPYIIVKWHVTYKKKNAACSLHVHCVSRKKTEPQNSGIAINSLFALFSLILDSLLTACAALFSFCLSLSSCSYKNSFHHPIISSSVILPFISPCKAFHNHTVKYCLSPPL